MIRGTCAVAGCLRDAAPGVTIKYERPWPDATGKWAGVETSPELGVCGDHCLPDGEMRVLEKDVLACQELYAAAREVVRAHKEGLVQCDLCISRLAKAVGL